ncbi:MAG TPA: hypothetical protein VGN21_19300 [Stellaceae bacterium]|jgi:hypothetical protein
MFFFVIALPGRFGMWCDAIAAGLAARVLGPTHIIHSNSLEELSSSALQLDVLRAVVASRQAGGRLRRALIDANRKFVVAFEDPLRACADLARSSQSDLPHVIKQVASGAAAVMAYRTAPGALALRAETDWLDPLHAARAVAEHLELAVSVRDITEVVGEVDAAGLTRGEGEADAWWHALGEPERAMTEGALWPYLREPDEVTPASIVWAGGLFFIGDRFDQGAARPIDITGRARCLLHGPYIMLPPGTWSAVLSLQFSRETAEHDFLVEVVTDRQLASTTIRPHHDGHLDAELTFVIDAQSDSPVSIRLSTQRAAFDGLVMLTEARLLQHPD